MNRRRTEPEPQFAPETPTSASRALPRRDFLKTSALVGGLGAAGVSAACERRPTAGELRRIGPYQLCQADQVIYSTCLQCHVDCQIKAKIEDGTLAKLDGSPFSPQNYLPHLPHDTSLERAARADGKLCAKGQAGIQTYYDPYWLLGPFSPFIRVRR